MFLLLNLESSISQTLFDLPPENDTSYNLVKRRKSARNTKRSIEPVFQVEFDSPPSPPEAQIKSCRDATINAPNLERFIKDIQRRLPDLDFEGKRLALDMLGITVWIDDESVEITGSIPVDKAEIVTMRSSLHSHNDILPFSLSVSTITI